jgi:hypothetical protein
VTKHIDNVSYDADNIDQRLGLSETQDKDKITSFLIAIDILAASPAKAFVHVENIHFCSET